MSLSTVLGHIWEGDHELIENLNDLEASFWVIIRGKDTGSLRSFRVLKHFLQIHQPKIPVVDIHIIQVEDASLYGAALLPQLRIYHRGNEFFRHHGIANVDILTKMHQMSLRF